MNGAHALIETLVAAGVDTCFMNPGTSEMHFVAALDDVPDMHSVLALFEGVATGAAEGYARMAGKPAAVLLHLGPGLGNGLANLHNARRGRVPVVNIIGDHATYHAKYDAPLQSDINSIAKGVSGWIKRSTDPDQVGGDAAEAIQAAYGRPGQVATLILPADVCWLESSGPAEPLPVPEYAQVDSERVESIASVLRSGESVGILMGGQSVMEAGLVSATKVASATGAKLICETFPTRLQRGAGRPAVDRLGYLAEFAQMQLNGLQHLILVETSSPVSFFAYPERPSDLVPEGCEVHVLTVPGEDSLTALNALVAALGAQDQQIPLVEPSRPELPTGPLTAETFAMAIGALLPDNAVVVDEGNTAGLFVSGMT
ncbi:MAG: acetolactate synthase large subunit, partial [Microthrixaceae bacterium]|nr:acetolactate synthase large subunit [Microthrixaceae bacterium]